MTDPNQETHIEAEDARAGATPHVVRYVLGISLALIVLIFLWLFVGLG